MIKPEDVTIIIPHLGADEQQEYAFVECIKSLQKTSPDIPLIVVSNGDTKDEDHKHTYHLKIAEQGQCKAVNAAVATTNTPWIFVTNDDMIYAPRWFEKLCRLGKSPYVSVDLAEDYYCISSKFIEPRAGAPTFEVFFAGGAGGDFDKAKWLEFASSYKGE